MGINLETLQRIWNDYTPPLNLFNWPMTKTTEYVHGQVFPSLVSPSLTKGKITKEVQQQIVKELSLSSGTKYDTGKPRMDLLDSSFLEEVAQVLTFGANKYSAHNWRNGINYSRLIAAAYRHLGSINAGEDIDPESGLPHVAHLGCCIMFLSSMMRVKPELDDRYKA